jgi:predicted nucleic acid-binding Zn ribbon protein
VPTYRFACEHCHGEFEAWYSIHDDDLPMKHDSQMVPGGVARCNGRLVKVISAAPIHGLNSTVNRADEREKGWSRDMPAYKRLRDDGLQPPGIDGCGDLEQQANDEWFVKTGGQFGVPENRRDEINEMLADGQVNHNNWSPVEEMQAARAKEKTK